MAVLRGKKSAKSGPAAAESTPQRRSTRNREDGTQSKATPQQPGAQALLMKNATVSQLKETTKTTMTTTQAVHVEQSTQIVQTLLHGCLSSIAYLRSLFPQNCYTSRYYLNKSNHWSYEDYASGADTSSERDIISRGGLGGAIIALKKGKSSRVDRFLDLMETGIFDSLRRGYLKYLHLTIHESPSRPRDALESWTFTFHYQPTAGTEPSTLASIDLNGSQSNIITLCQAKQSLNDLVRQVVNTCATLPTLPEAKSILLHIGYTDHRPEEYFAPGFDQPAMSTLRFPTDDGWSRITERVGIINTGHHAASLCISHLTRPLDDNPYTVPSGMDCNKEEELLDDVVKDMDKEAKALLVGPQPHNASPSGVEIVSVEEAQGADMHATPKDSSHIVPISSNQKTQPNPRSPLEPSRVSHGGLMRLTATDRLEEERLRMMLQPPVKGSNDQATQLVSTGQDQDEQTTGQPIDDSADKVIFREEKIDELDRARSLLLDPRKEVSQILTTHEHMLPITVGCECGYDGEEGDMIHCEFCEKYQHLHCYGYLGKDDRRISTIHICYPCLLSGEVDTLMKVRDQSLRRRALWLLQQTSYSNNRLFATALTCTDQEAEKVAKELRGLGLLAPSLGASKKGKSQVVLNPTKDAKTRMTKAFFDPTFGIEHHLESSVAVGRKLLSNLPKVTAKRQRESHDGGSGLPPSKRVLEAYTSGYIDANEVSTPQADKRL